MENKRENPAHFVSAAFHMFRESMFELRVFCEFGIVHSCFLFYVFGCFGFYVCIYIYMFFSLYSECSLPQAVANECLLVRTKEFIAFQMKSNDLEACGLHLPMHE